MMMHVTVVRILLYSVCVCVSWGVASVWNWRCNGRTLPQPRHVQTTSAVKCNSVLSDW